MAGRSLIATLVVAGGLLTAAARYSTAPAPVSMQENTSEEAKKATVKIETPTSKPAPEMQGSAVAHQVLHDQLCLALDGPGTPCTLDKAAPYQAEAVIAIFPDPIHTHLSLRFDRNVDALIAAAQDSGWYLDRQWLPWSWMSAGEPGGDKDLPELVNTRTYRHGFESVPGFISFRPISGRQEKRLIVFIVGDSPISGILPDQFRGAYDYTRILETGPSDNAADRKELRILGPSFTGSISSLATLLATLDKSDPAPPFTSVRILSPTISRDVEHIELKTASGDVPVSFRSYGMSQNCRIRSVVDFVNRQTSQDSEVSPTGQTTRIALLTEDESAFGRVSVDPEPLPTESAAAHKTKPVPDPCDLRRTDLLHLSFPRDISHLRSAYQKKSVWGFGGASSGGTSLGLDFSDPHEELDAVPNFSGGQNAASVETTLRQLAETLTERDIRVVLLNATDVFDELFLARMLGRLAPNISVIVLDSDALFLHQGGGDTYNHLFVATPFPSLPLDLFWAAPADRLRDPRCTPRIFPSESTLGAYLAAGSLLANDDPLQPFARQQSCTAEYSSPFERTARPPLWLVSVEHGHQWPLAMMEMNDHAAPANIPAIPWPRSAGYGHVTGLIRHHVPVSLWLGLFSLLVMCAVHLYGSTAVHINSTALWDYAISDAGTRPYRLALQLGLSLLAMVAIRFLMPPELRLLAQHSLNFRIVGDLALGALALLSALQVVCLIMGSTPNALLQGLIHPVRLSAKVGRGLAIGTAAAVAAVLLSWLPWRLLTRIPGERVEFFERYRALYLFSGVAPSLPILLLLIAIALALFSRLNRLYFVGPWRPILPTHTPDALRLPSEETAAPIFNFLARWFSQGTVLLWAAVLLILLLVHSSLDWAAPTTLDGHIFTVFVKALAAVVVGSLCFDLLRAWRLWRMLRALVLRPLERTPLRRGFDRIKGMSWERIWRTMDSSPQFSYHPVRRALELALSAPSRLGLPLGPSVVQRDWNEVLTSITDEHRAQSWGNLLASLAAAAENVLPDMVTAWSAECGCATAKDNVLSERSKELDGHLDVAGSVLAAQEEFVALVYIQYVRIVLIQVRHSLFTAAASYVLLAAALTQYPIVGRHAVEIGLFLLFGFLATVAVIVYAAINRDSILSRTTETEPGKLDFDFYVKIATYLGLPLLGLLASQFPELSGSLFSLLQPGSGVGK